MAHAKSNNRQLKTFYTRSFFLTCQKNLHLMQNTSRKSNLLSYYILNIVLLRKSREFTTQCIVDEFDFGWWRAQAHKSSKRSEIHQQNKKTSLKWEEKKLKTNKNCLNCQTFFELKTPHCRTLIKPCNKKKYKNEPAKLADLENPFICC